MKTLNSQVIAGLNLSEAITYYPKTAPTVLPQIGRALAAQASV